MPILVTPSHGHGKINRFVKGEVSNPKGRPLKIYTYLRRTGYTTDDIRAAFFEAGFTKMGDLDSIYKDPKMPVILKVLAHAYKKAIEKGDYRFIKDFIEQCIGLPKQQIEQDIKTDIKVTFNFNNDNSSNLLTG